MIGVVLGRIAQFAGIRFGHPLAATAIGVAMAVLLGVWLLLAIRSPYALLPPAGLLAGLLYRKQELISLSPRDRGDDPHRPA